MNSNASGSIKGKSLVKKTGGTNEEGVKNSFGLLRMFSVYGGRSPGVLTAGRGAGIVDQPSQSPVINKIDRSNP